MEREIVQWVHHEGLIRRPIAHSALMSFDVTNIILFLYSILSIFLEDKSNW